MLGDKIGNLKKRNYESLRKRERKKKQEKEKNTSLEKKGKLLRVLLSGRWLPGNQG